MTEKRAAILVGVFGAAQGIRGEIRVKSFTADPSAIAAYGMLSNREGRRFRLLSVRTLRDDMVVARVEGVENRTEAEALTHTELFVDRGALPAADEDEFYHADLVGLSAELTDGRWLGTIAAVVNYGGGDLLEIRPPIGDTILVPFTRAFVPDVDLQGRRVLIEPGAIAEDDSDAAVAG